MTPTPRTNTAGSRTWTPRRWMRPLLVLLAVPNLVTGRWAIVDPQGCSTTSRAGRPVWCRRFPVQRAPRQRRVRRSLGNRGVGRAGRLAAPRRRDRHSHGWASRVLVAPRGLPPGQSRRDADRLRGCSQHRIAVDRSGVGVGGALHQRSACRQSGRTRPQRKVNDAQTITALAAHVSGSDAAGARPARSRSTSRGSSTRWRWTGGGTRECCDCARVR